MYLQQKTKSIHRALYQPRRFLSMGSGNVKQGNIKKDLLYFSISCINFSHVKCAGGTTGKYGVSIE